MPKSGSGFEYYLKSLQKQRTEARAGAPVKILILLNNGPKPILDLAAEARMELSVFMDAIGSMKESNLILLTGPPQDPERIMIDLTSAGRSLVAGMSSANA